MTWQTKQAQDELVRKALEEENEILQKKIKALADALEELLACNGNAAGLGTATAHALAALTLAGRRPQ